MTDPRKLAKETLRRWNDEGMLAADDPDDPNEVMFARELLSALDALDAARQHAGFDVPPDRIVTAHSAMPDAAWAPNGPGEGHRVYRQSHGERCYLCSLLGRLEAVEAERDELQAALDAADGRLEIIRIYEDFLSELGIDTDQPQEEIFAELRRRWDELVVAASPSVMENR